MLIPSYSLVDEGSDLLWMQFRDLVKEMQWTTDDDSVLGLLPVHSSTRCVFAQNNEDGSFLGCVVWNEYDEMAWLGFYIVAPSVRKAGLGSVIWERAMERIRATGKVLGLRAVPEMAARYAAKDTPVEISRLRKVLISSSEMRKVCDRYSSVSGLVKLTSELTPEERLDLIRFDSEITGRDRSNFLEPYFSMPCVEGAMIVDADGKIIAYAAATTTGFEEDRLFKLAPVYASSIAEFAALTKALLPFCEKISTNAQIMVQILSGTVGERELEAVIGPSRNVDLLALFSDRIENKMNLDKCYAPHNHNIHYDG